MNPIKSIFDLSFRQLLILAVILLFGTIGTISLYYTLNKKEHITLSDDFITASKELTASIEKEINLNLESLNSLNALYAVTDSVSREQFKVFNTGVLKRVKSIQALEWIPLVSIEYVPHFEYKARNDGLSTFKITERAGDNMVPAGIRQLYYPVFYIEPLPGNEKALGFDLGSNEARLLALEKAIETNEMVATSRITLVQDETSQKGMLVFCPIKKKGEILGFVLGVFKIDDLIIRAVGHMANLYCNLTIYDISAAEGNQLLAQQNVESLKPEADDASIRRPHGIYYEQTVKIADREWLILSTPTQIFLNSSSNTALLSLVICGILSMAFFYFFYRNFREFNQQIKNQILLESTVHERTEELQEYAHVVSHDLKSPLRNIEALISWLKEDNKDKFDENSLEHFNHIDKTLEKMELLITNILGYSSINISANKIREVDLNKIIKNLNAILFVPNNISINVLSKLPVIKGDKMKLQQLFQNLISNAINFSDKEIGIIEIDVIERGSYYLFSVRDNGIGIEKKYQEKIFQIFQVLNNNKTSTGIGLAIVKKIVAQFNGEIWVKSEFGEGSTFYFTLKKR